MLGKVVILEVDALRAGDILLHRPLRRWPHQRLISRVTGSPYTHASIYLGDGTILEAMPFKGVCIRAMAGAGRYERIEIFRLQMTVTDERAQKLKDFARELVRSNAGYNWIGLLNFFWKRSQDVLLEDAKPLVPSALSKRYFCSSVVAAFLFEVGIFDTSLQLLYKEDMLSPGALHTDVSFGWHLGFLVDRSTTALFEDIAFVSSTRWIDVEPEEYSK